MTRPVAQLPPRIILTGASGTLGRNLFHQLVRQPGVEILILTRKPVIDRSIPDHVRYEQVDFSNKGSIIQSIRKFIPTSLIHCAAAGLIFPRIEWFEMIRFNVEVTLSLFEACSQIKGCHFIHVSTGLVYQKKNRALSETDALDNTHPYGASKAAADILLRSAAMEFRVPLTLFRPFSFTGLHDDRTRLFPSILRSAVEKSPLLLSPGEQVRDFCSVRDVARGILLALTKPPAPNHPSVYNLGSGRTTTLKDLINQHVLDELKLPVSLKFGAVPYGPFEPMHLVADIRLAEEQLGWKPLHNLSHAIWELAQETFPSLALLEPRQVT